MEPSDPITLTTVRTVRPGCESAFETALHDFVQRSLPMPGQMGVHILRPPPGSGSRQYGIIRKFSGTEALEAFRQSAEYAEWSRLALNLTEGTSRSTELTGLESWCTLPGTPVQVIPRWKIAVATFCGVYPLAMLLQFILGPLIGQWPFLLRNALFNGCIVGMLTWVVMPFITRILHPWLHSNSRPS